jgi:plastocyanin
MKTILPNAPNESKTIERHNIMFSSPPYRQVRHTKCVSLLSPFLRHLNMGTLALVMFVALALLITTRGKDSETRRSAPTKATKTEIIIDNLSFSPDTLRLPAADLKVTWINRGYVAGLVASADNQFKKSPVLKTGQHFSNSFAPARTYSYICPISPRVPVGEITTK